MTTDLQSARDMTLTMFSGLWMHPRATYAFCPAAKIPELSEKMKARAEAFIAQEIGVPVEIETSDDLELLRSIYRICKRVDAAEVRDWAKTRERAERAVERKAAQAARKGAKDAKDATA